MTNTTASAVRRPRLGLRRHLFALTATATALTGLVLAPAAPATAAAVDIDLYAVTGTTTLPGGQNVKVWGYRLTPGSVSEPGGPVLTVDEGDTVSVTLHNETGETSAVLFQGQTMPPDLAGVASGSTKTYTFTAGHAGTYLYEAGLTSNGEHQVPMGLYGALVVRPATAGQAYAGAGSAYDDQAVLLLSELDPALNNATNPAGFDLRKFNPKYTLINGRAHPDTAPIDTVGGHTVLLRYVNAGLQYHSMGVLGAGQRMIALDGSPLDLARNYTAETIGPGQTADALILTPGTEADPQRLTVYDASLSLHNSNLGGAGGMVTTVDVAGSGPGADATGPVASAAAYDGTTLSASIDDTDVGNGAVTEAEFYVDDLGGAATPMTGAFGTPQVAVTVPFSVATGEHVIYVRGRDETGNWGEFTSVLVSGADQGGPTSLAPSLAPGLTNHGGAGGVDISATADDSSSGNTNIAAAEYFIDTDPTPPTTDGTGVSMTVNNAAPVASVDATIPASVVNALSEGSHTVWIHAKDAQGNWGEAISISLDIDLTGPDTSGIVVAPTPNNGTLGVNSSTPAVQVVATTLADPVSSNLNSTIAKAELFIDTVGANGSGIPLIASDGFFNDTNESGYANIPLSTVRALSNGTHTFYVHAKDAAGNWGPTGSGTLLVDKTAPTLSGVTVTPAGDGALRQFTVTGTATDGQVAITRAEWFVGTDPGAGKGTALSLSGGPGSYSISGNLDGSRLSAGNVVVKVRARDEAGNWSKATLVNITVVGSVWFSTLGATNPPGVGGTADAADIYRWIPTVFTRATDATADLNLAATANVDGYQRVDATHFYLSFAADTSVPTLGLVANEDIVFYNAGTWTKVYDGSANGITDDVDAFSFDGTTLYLSTRGNVSPPGVSAGDNSDVYRWSGGSSYTTVWDATADGGLPLATNVDGLKWVDATHLFVSFDPATTTVPGIGTQQDEDIVKWAAGTWSVYFDGTARGLSPAANLDIDAFDIP